MKKHKLLRGEKDDIIVFLITVPIFLITLYYFVKGILLSE